MLNVALTGNVAAGKSTVVEHFRRWGATVIDADQIVREVEAPGTAVLAAITRRFGKTVLAADGSLDRAALRARVMGDDAALGALNAIVHPEVRRHRDARLRAAEAAGDLLVVSDIPLLFEASDPKQFDVVVLLDAPPELRRARLATLRGLADDDAARLIASQLPTERKRAASDIVIDNEGTLGALEERASGVFRSLRRQAARRAAGEAAHRLLLVARRAADLAAGPAGTAARYADAGLEVFLFAANLEPGPEAERLTAALGLTGVRLVGELNAGVAERAAAELRADAIVACRAGAAPRWATALWTCEPESERPAARLDVRPWRDAVARVADAPSRDRESFTQAGESPPTPRDDLFGSA